MAEKSACIPMRCTVKAAHVFAKRSLAMDRFDEISGRTWRILGKINILSLSLSPSLSLVIVSEKYMNGFKYFSSRSFQKKKFHIAQNIARPTIFDRKKKKKSCKTSL